MPQTLPLFSFFDTSGPPINPWSQVPRRHPAGIPHLRTNPNPPLDHIRTIYDLHSYAMQAFHGNPYLGWRPSSGAPYQWLSYGTVGRLRDDLGAGLVHLGLNPGDTLGIYGPNCPEWVLLDAACARHSLVTVPLYDTLGPDAVKYIAGHAELVAVAVALPLLPVLLQCLDSSPRIKIVIVWSPPSPDGWATELPDLQANINPSFFPTGGNERAAGLHVLSVRDLQRLGTAYPRSARPPEPSDTHTICYTSGTTGVPKGVVLSHGQILANTCGIMDYVPLATADAYLSYLPLAHIYERVNLYLLPLNGVRIGFYLGDVLTLLDDVETLRPTIFASVPRLWNRIYDKVNATIEASGPAARFLFNRAFKTRLAFLKDGQRPHGVWDTLFDRLVFAKIRAKLGGRVRLMITGASPISPTVFDFLRVCFTPDILEGYGMTETACVISLTRAGDPISGHVGGPTPAMEIKLADIPDMGYTNADLPYPRGEICVRSPACFGGYYKEPGLTAEVMDDGGWLHTGDVGTWLPGGRLKVIDRKKNIFKLAQGEYVAPEKIEMIYARSPLVQQVFVYGDSLAPALVAVAVPDPEIFLPWAQKKKVSETERTGTGPPAGASEQEQLAAYCAMPSLVQEVLGSLIQEGRQAELRGFEQIVALTLVPTPMSVENGLLTPTFKIKRQEAQKVFQADLDRMYGK